VKQLPPPFLPNPGEEFDYGLFIADQIAETLYYWQLAITLTETPGEVLKEILAYNTDPDNQE
jgi:energy-converting hydrogenase Eha subunit F